MLVGRTQHSANMLCMPLYGKVPIADCREVSEVVASERPVMPAVEGQCFRLWLRLL